MKPRKRPNAVLFSKSLPTSFDINDDTDQDYMKFPSTHHFVSDEPSFAESNSSTEESVAELEVIKAIMTREGYLSRLESVARTVKKKIKPELPDLIDFVRLATLDVVQAISKWRDVKKDATAVFLWNGTNYLLRIATDLDFLADYRAVRKWMGFNLLHNPFCVPCPMEEGIGVFSDSTAMDAKHVDQGHTIDGFAIGGQAPSKFALGAHPAEDLTVSPPPSPGKKSRTDKAANEEPVVYGTVGATLKHAATRLVGIYGMKKAIKEKAEKPVESFILNSDMISIRRAEKVLLEEEKIFGKMDRSSVVQGGIEALQQAALENEAAKQLELARAAEYEASRTTMREKIRSLDPKVEDFPSGTQTPLSKSVSRAASRQPTPAQLAPIINSALSKARPPNAAVDGGNKQLSVSQSTLEVAKYHKKRSLGDRLAEIAQLKANLQAEKLALENEQRGYSEQAKSTPKSKLSTRGGSRPLSRGDSRASVKSAATRGQEQGSPVANHLALDPGSFAEGSLSNQLLSADGRGGQANGQLGPFSPSSSARPSTQQGSPGSVRWIDEQAIGSSINDPGAIGVELSANSGPTDEELELIAIEAEEEANRLRVEKQKLRDWRLNIVALGKRKGRIPPPELYDVLDYFAGEISRMVCGYAKRRWTKKHRIAVKSGATLIGARMRGFLVRNRNYIAKVRNKAANDIQRSFRGWKSRTATAAMALARRRNRGATQIQRIWRGIWGRSRMKGKRSLDAESRNIRMNVDPRNLFVSDVRDLRMRIYYSLERTQPQALPPDEVLFLLRLVAAILQDATSTNALGDLSFINTRTYTGLDAYNLSWEDCERLLSRSERFLRLIRTVAYAPSSVPPRLINMPSKVRLLYAAQSKNRRWCLETFESMGHGAKLCCQLFKWLLSLMEIAERQQEFISFFSTSFPDWLPRLVEIQREYRSIEFKLVLETKCMNILKDIREQITNDPIYRNLLGREIAAIRRLIQDYDEQLKAKAITIQHVQDGQTKREQDALIVLEAKLKKMHAELLAINKSYHDAAVLATDGNREAAKQVPKIRSQITLKQLAIGEVETQIQMLTVQSAHDQMKRNADGSLELEIRIKAITAGESKALVIDSEVKSRVLLSAEEVSFSEELSIPKQRIHKGLKEKESQCLNIYQKLFMIADDHLKQFEEDLAESIRNIRNLEKQAVVHPSEAELQEERYENEHEAKLAKFQKKMFIPEAAIKAPIERARPVLVCLARDLPAFAKEKIHREIVVTMPGIFVSMDVEENLGISLAGMQAILDCKRCIIATVDHGMTKSSRSQFLTLLEKTVAQLIPSPFVVIAMADDYNKRLSAIDMCFGASRRDLSIMKDGDIKVCLEAMAETLYDWGQEAFQDKIVELAHNVFPPSPEFLIVAEALYVLQSDSEDFLNPDKTIKPMSWVTMQSFLLEPRTLLSTLKSIRRGRSSLPKLEIVNSYMQHELWPRLGYSVARQFDRVLNLMAQFVEYWVQCELLTKDRGGVPLSPLTKGSLRGIQTVVVVSDVAIGDPEDLTNTGESTIGWRQASLRLLRTALQDLRVLKISKKIDNSLYNVSIYREDSMVYFDAYDPQNSQVFFLAVRESQVNQLLLPNTNPGAMNNQPEPPLTSQEMYTRLAALMHIKQLTTKQVVRKVLYLHQDLLFLRNFTTKINGHLIHVKCYEAALGQIVFKAYIPEYSAVLECSVDEEARLRLSNNYDLELENHLRDSLDGRLLLPFMMDRLKIHPSRPMIGSHGSTITGTFLNRNDAVTIKKSQGLALKLNTKAGAGRPIFKKIVHFCGVPHMLMLKTSTSSKTLRIVAYEPRTQAAMELRLSSFVRRVITKSEGDHSNIWGSTLLKRLKMLWRGHHNLSFDYTVYRAVHKLAKKRVTLSMEIISEERLRVSLVEPTNNIPQVSIVTKDQVFTLLRFVYSQKLSPGKAKKPQGLVNAVSNIFSSLVSFGSVSTPKHSQQGAGAPQLELDENSMSTLPSGLRGVSQAEASITSSAAAGRLLEDAPAAVSHDKSVLMISDDVSIGSLVSMSSDGTHQTVEQEWFVVSNSLEKLVKDPAALRKFAKAIENVTEWSAAGRKFLIANPITLEFSDDARFFDARKIPLKTSLLHHDMDVRPSLKAELVAGGEEGLAEGSVWSVLRARKQAAWFDMEAELNELADRKAREVSEKKKLIMDRYAYPSAQEDSLSGSGSYDATDMAAARSAKARSTAGQNKDLGQVTLWTHDGKSTVVLEKELFPADIYSAIRGGERTIFEAGVKVNYRSGKTRWHGHCQVKAFESFCYYTSPHPEAGKTGRRIRFQVFDPTSTHYYEGCIRNDKHLFEVCGIHGNELYNTPTATREMILYISRYRLFLTRVPSDELPADVPPDTAMYRVEFEVDRLYSIEKVTPIGLGGDNDITANKIKLVESEIARGKKLLRIVRRVSGVLLHLVVFEIPHGYGSGEGTNNNDEASQSDSKTNTNRRLRKLKTDGEDDSVASPASRSNIAFAPDDSTIVSSIGGGGPTDSVIGFPATSVQLSIPDNNGFAESRTGKRNLQVYDPPTIRIICFDPISKTRSSCVVPPPATLEIAGGIYSSFLDNSRRRELAKLVCEALFLVYPRGKPFELNVRWAGSVREATVDVVAAKGSWRSQADRVVKRMGKIFRSIVRITGIEVLVTMYLQPILTKKRLPGHEEHAIHTAHDDPVNELERNQLMAGGDAGHYLAGDGGPQVDTLQLIVNFYASATSEAAEMVVTTEEQVQRLGKSILLFNEGSIRAAACRKLLRFFKCELHEDSQDHTKQILHVDLMNTDKGFLQEYGKLKTVVTSDQPKPVGVPKVFMPMDTCGYLIFRRELELINKDKTLPDRNYIVSVHTRSHNENPDGGLVIKVYDKDTEETSVMHIQPNALQLMCNDAGEPDLLKDIGYALTQAEEDLGDFIMADVEKVDYGKKSVELMDYLCGDIVCINIGVFFNEHKKVIPYLRIAPKGLNALMIE